MLDDTSTTVPLLDLNITELTTNMTNATMGQTTVPPTDLLETVVLAEEGKPDAPVAEATTATPPADSGGELHAPRPSQSAL